MKRDLIKTLPEKIGKKASLKGRIINVRKLGSLIFTQLQDYTGIIQIVWEKDIDIKPGEVVSVSGTVKEDKRAKNGVEITGDNIKTISKPLETTPVDLTKSKFAPQLSTLLDHRTTTLRHPKIQAIFRLYDLLLEGYEKVMREEGFVEIKTPKILETASEGGANFFKLEYFDREAYLAQSPQLYKQIMVGVFERVFEIGSAFRAEPHFTTRHINEYTSLDAEMGFIESFKDVTATLNKVIKKIFEHIAFKGQEYLDTYEVNLSKVPDEIPHLKLAEIRQIVKKEYGYQIPESTDIDPEGERLAGRYAKEKFNSDFLFITHYPWEEKPFYTMPSKDNPKETEGYDLLYKGMEIVTGSQRIHDYKMLIDNMSKKAVKPKGLEFYLDTFKYSMPPHGGWGWGSERTIQLMLGLKSVKEATLFPRDVKRLKP